MADKKSTIWFVTCGSRGDHEPVATLGLALEAAGHRTKVFGRGFMRDFFLGLGLDFESASAPPVLHEGNARRASLQRRALDAGFVGDDGLTDYLLDVFILETDRSLRYTLQLAEEGDEELFSKWMWTLGVDKAVKAGDFDTWEERNRTWLQREAEERGASVEDCAAHRRNFRALWHKLAAETGVDAVSAFDAFTEAFGFRPAQKPFKEWASEHLTWSSCMDVSKWWDKWQDKDPNWLRNGTADVVTLSERFSKWGLENLLFSFDSARHKPDVLLYHLPCSMQAWGLRHLRGVSILPLVVTPEYPWKLSSRIVMYKTFLGLEKQAGYGNPIESAGVWKFMGMQETPWNVVALTVLRLNEDDPDNRLYDSDDWLATVRSCYTGSWNLEDVLPEQQDAEAVFGSASDRDRLERFLAEAEDEPPVYFGWGSMLHSKGPAALASLVVKTLRLTGHRAVFVVGWSGVDPEHVKEAFRAEYPSGGREEAEARVLVLPAVRPTELLPRCAAAVHHGGIGTIHAVLRAGTPLIVTPIAYDQFSNGTWVQSLGCGLMASKLEELEAEELAEKLRRVVGDKETKAKAQDIASQMRAEPGVAGAVRLVEKFLHERPEPDAATTVEAWKCPDGVYTVLDAEDNPTLEVHYRDGSGHIHADDGARHHVGDMRYGKFHRREGGTQEWCPYDVQVVQYLDATLRRGHLSSDGKTGSLDNPLKFLLPTDASDT